MPKHITLEDVGRLYKDTIVQHNDNTRVLNVPHRVYNQALQRRFQNGAKQHAAWDKDHPVAAQWRDVATAVPFAVATAPIAGTALSAGKAVAGVPKVAKVIKTITKSPIGKIASKAKPYIDAGLALTGLTSGIKEAVNNGFTPKAALELSGGVPYNPFFIKQLKTVANSKTYLPTNYAYRYTDLNELNDVLKYKDFREMPIGITVEGATRTFKTKSGRKFSLSKPRGNSHGGKAFAAGVNWKDVGGTTSGSTKNNLIIGIPGNNTLWQVGHHGKYSKPQEFSTIQTGKPLFKKFNEDGDAEIPITGIKIWNPKNKFGFYTPYKFK